MENLYVKNTNGDFIPIQLDIARFKDFEDKLVIVTVGNDTTPSTPDFMEQVQNSLVNSKIIREIMRKTKNASLLTLPHLIKLEFLAKKELEAKTICVSVHSKENVSDLPEIQKQLKNHLGREVVVLPVPLSLKEYQEIKTIKERIRIRKERNGGGLNISQK